MTDWQRFEEAVLDLRKVIFKEIVEPICKLLMRVIG
jgi:hypothetical protein